MLLPDATPVFAATALIVLGSLCFLPGAYMTRIAYLAHKKVQGYSFNDIPDFL